MSMHRRALLAALTSTALASGAVARTRASPPRRIGVLRWYRPNIDSFAADFEQRLGELGIFAGHDVMISYHYAEGDTARAQRLAKELVDARVDLIVAQATESHFEVSGGFSAGGKPLNHARLVESSAPPLLRALDSREESPARVRQRGSPQRSGISCIHGMREAPTVTGNPTSPRLVRDP